MSTVAESASWSSLELAKLVVSILVPLAILGLGIWFDRRLKEIELARRAEAEQRQSEAEERRREKELAQQAEAEQRRLQLEEHRREVERIEAPHIEFTVECECLGIRQDNCLLNIVLVADNRGHVRHQFPSIRLRILGIKQGEPFGFWAGREPRAEFPHKLIEAEVVPPGYNYIFVEPNVAQRITYVTLIPAGYSHLLVKAEFKYDKYTPHSAESVFALSGQPIGGFPDDQPEDRANGLPAGYRTVPLD
jgi:hypothetical protein